MAGSVFRVQLIPTLSGALALGGHRVVAFTGGGGKTTTMFRLARELAHERVLVTTTTKIWLAQAKQADLILANDPSDACERLAAGWERGIRALGIGVTPDDKLRGVPPEWVTALAQVADRVLIEADGAAGRPITAPRDYEPVIPPTTEIVVPTVGIEAVGAPLDAEHVHRPSEIAAGLGRPPGSPGQLTVDDVAAVLLSAWGNVKGAPGTAEIVPLVNKVDGFTAYLTRTPSAPLDKSCRNRFETAFRLADSLLELHCDRVVLASLADEPPKFLVAMPRVQSRSPGPPGSTSSAARTA